MKISPKYSSADWEALELSDPTRNEDGWERAFEIFLDRFNGRYFDILEAIEKQLYSGFVVMAIDCMLIETLEQFYQGKEDSDRTSRADFIKCLKEREPFKSLIEEKYVETFQNHFRNGILHQAESKKGSKVRIIGPIVKPVDPDDINKGLDVNRREFHAAVQQAYETYIDLLIKKNPINQELRQRFKTKMDMICR